MQHRFGCAFARSNRVDLTRASFGDMNYCDEFDKLDVPAGDETFALRLLNVFACKQILQTALGQNDQMLADAQTELLIWIRKGWL